jgi:hypothetical protein
MRIKSKSPIINSQSQISIILLFILSIINISYAGSMIYAYNFGGNGADIGYAIAVDSVGCAYILGETYSTNFPTSAGAIDRTFNGGSTDLIISKVYAEGTGLVYSTYLGGREQEGAKSIAVDKFGCAYITGYTNSSVDFPVTLNAFDTSYNGGETDGFVCKLNAAGTALVYSTYLGGSHDVDWFYDCPQEIKVDNAGCAYVAGYTQSHDFPTTSGAFDTTCNSIYAPDVFVTKFNPAGTGLSYSTFIGGDNEDYAYGLDIDNNGNAYIAGVTRSQDYPITNGAFNTNGPGPYNNHIGFVTKLNPTGTALVYSTYLGHGWCYDIALDNSNCACVTGSSDTSFPTTPGAYSNQGSCFIAKLNDTGSGLILGTLLGNLVQSNSQIFVDKDQNICTCDGDIPIHTILKFNPSCTLLIDSTKIYGIYDMSMALDKNGYAYLVSGIDIYYDTEIYISKYRLLPPTGIEPEFWIGYDEDNSGYIYKSIKFDYIP